MNRRPRNRAPSSYIPCYACSGNFSLAYDGDDPIALHTLPYCPEFEAIATVVDAITHSERCREAAKART